MSKCLMCGAPVSAFVEDIMGPHPKTHWKFHDPLRAEKDAVIEAVRIWAYRNVCEGYGAIEEALSALELAEQRLAHRQKEQTA